MGEESICRELPASLSSFVDAFVDFSVSGVFLPPIPPQNPNPNPNPTPSSPNPTSDVPSPSPPLQLQTRRYPPPDRLIAVGDVHGDLCKFKQALHLAGLVDASDRWVGGDTTLVQIGDVLDRGGQELKILYFLERLKREAFKTGGAVITMNGNHEIMNVEGDFRFVTEAGLDEFRVWADWFCVGNAIKSLCKWLPEPEDPFKGIPSSFPGVSREFIDGFRARIAALRPGGPITSRFLSQNDTVLVLGDSVFVHGGLLPRHVLYGLERINEDVKAWMNGLKGRISPGHVREKDAVVWLRKYSNQLAEKCDCSTLEHVLSTIPGAKRMIMGHTIQRDGINGVCENRAIRIDVGMSKGCGNRLPEVLEINKNSTEVQVLTSNPLYKKQERGSSSSAQADTKEGLRLLLPPPEHGPTQVEVKS